MDKSRMKMKLWGMLIVAAICVGSSGSLSYGMNMESKEIAEPYQMYTYERMIEDVNKLAAAYPELVKVQSIGTTPYGREIMAVKLGNGEASIMVDGSQHAREWMSTNLIVYMIDRYAYAYVHNMKYDQYAVRELLDQCSIWFVPMVNPDGVTLQQTALDTFPEEVHGQLLSMNGGSTNFKSWKANAEGIDINRQYPAMWSDIRNSPTYPMHKNYKGSEPAQTAEAQSMIRFVNNTDPEIALSYHSSGRVLYWHFFTAPEQLERDKKMASKIGAITGCRLVKPEQNPSGGGFTDWFIAQFGRPGFTAELGPYQEETELPLWTFTDIWSENQRVPLYLASEGYKLWHQRYPIEKADTEIQLFAAANLCNRPTDSYATGFRGKGNVRRSYGRVVSGFIMDGAEMGSPE